MGSDENTGTSCNLKCCIAVVTSGSLTCLPLKDRKMSPQLTLSSLFSVLALAGLCVVTSARDLAGFEAPASASASPYAMQAELTPGLLPN